MANKPKTSTLHVRAEPGLASAFRIYCEEKGLNKSEVVRGLIKDLIGWEGEPERLIFKDKEDQYEWLERKIEEIMEERHWRGV